MNSTPARFSTDSILASVSNDEAALLRLWREKRGEAEPERPLRNLITLMRKVEGMRTIGLTTDL